MQILEQVGFIDKDLVNTQFFERNSNILNIIVQCFVQLFFQRFLTGFEITFISLTHISVFGFFNSLLKNVELLLDVFCFGFRRYRQAFKHSVGHDNAVPVFRLNPCQCAVSGRSAFIQFLLFFLRQFITPQLALLLTSVFCLFFDGHFLYGRQVIATLND